MKLSSLDAWKGIAIISVVFIHSFGLLSFSPAESFDWYFWITSRQALNFAVPVFFFISGYLSFSDKYSNATNFYKKRLARILIPYLSWCFIYIAFSSVMKKEVPSISDITYQIVTGDAIVIGYFIIVLIQFTLITPILYKISSINKNIMSLVVISIIGVSYTYITTFIFPSSKLSQFPYSALPFIVWYPFYHLGFMLNKYKPKININHSYIILIGMLSLSVLEGFYVGSGGNSSFAVSQLKSTSIIMSVILCIIIYKNISFNFTNKFLLTSGKYSFGIYLMHILVMRLIYKASGVINRNNFSEVLYCIAVAALAFFISLLSCIVIGKLLGNRSKLLIG